MLREDAIEDVIRQFSDPMAFLRELVQNALDAGSSEVDIQFSYDTKTSHGVISVVDWGEGMSRDIIETRLVRLFNSTKDDDFTKIGKFGIGFVSVFAMEPVVVCVDTGRDGEYWRILLHPDRSYELLELDHPVEGTQVDLHIEVDEERFAELEKEAREKVAKWCEFAPVPVLVEGDDIRGDFDLDGIVVARFEEEGTRAVAALHAGTGVGKFYNGGLALQAVPSDWPHVSFLIDSRYLEHTLTRDQVLQNKKFHAAIERLRELVEEQLTEEIRTSLATWPEDPSKRADWQTLCDIAAKTQELDVLVDTAFPTLRHGTRTGREVREARDKNRLMLTHGKSALATRMPKDYVLLDVEPDSGAHRVLDRVLGREVPVLEKVWVHPQTVELKLPGSDALLAEVEAALRHLGSTPTWVGYANFDYPGADLGGRGLLCLPDHTEVHHRADIKPFSMRKTDNDVLLNPKHAIVADAIAVAANEPEWAGYTLVKCAALSVEAVEIGELDGETDAALALAMLERRDRRLGT